MNLQNQGKWTRCPVLWHVLEQLQETTGINSTRRYENGFIYLNFFDPKRRWAQLWTEELLLGVKINRWTILNCSVKSSPKFPCRKNPVILSKLIIGHSQQTELCPANLLIGILVNFNARRRERKEEGKSCVTSVTITKFVVSRCAFCKLRRNFGFFCSVNYLSGSLRKHMTFVYLYEFKRSWFVICDSLILFRFVCFMFQGLLLCDCLFRAIIDLLSLLRRFFWSFLFLSFANIKQCLPVSFNKKYTHHRDFLRYSWAVHESFSAKLGKHITLWFALTLPSLKCWWNRKTPNPFEVSNKRSMIQWISL